MMTIEARVEAAVRRATAEQVRPIRLGPGQYVVASSSIAGHGYVVYVGADGAIACSCPSGEWDFPCKHALAVRELERRTAAGAA